MPSLIARLHAPAHAVAKKKQTFQRPRTVGNDGWRAPPLARGAGTCARAQPYLGSPFHQDGGGRGEEGKAHRDKLLEGDDV